MKSNNNSNTNQNPNMNSLVKTPNNSNANLLGNNSAFNFSNNNNSTTGFNSIKGKGTKINYHKAYNSINFKPVRNQIKELDSDNLMNFSENAYNNIDENYSANFSKGKKSLNKGNSTKNLPKKNSSKLEIKDLENYDNINENHFTTKSPTSPTMKNKEKLNSKKTLIHLYSSINNKVKSTRANSNFEANQFSYSDKLNDYTNNINIDNENSNSNCNNNEENDIVNVNISPRSNYNKEIPKDNLFDKLQYLKIRTKGILDMYAMRFNKLKMKSNGTI